MKAVLRIKFIALNVDSRKERFKIHDLNFNSRINKNKSSICSIKKKERETDMSKYK